MRGGIRFFLIRHGETEWNAKGIIRGISDVPLSAKGRAEAEALAGRLRGVPLASVHTSRLARARETAAILLNARGASLPLEIDEGLTDIDRGRWEGLTRDQARSRWPEIYDLWFSRPQETVFPDGESLLQVQDRARRAFDRIAGLAAGDTAVVTHHVVIRALLCSLLGLDLSRFRRFEAFPASISELRHEHGAWTLFGLNDVGHLKMSQA